MLKLKKPQNLVLAVVFDVKNIRRTVKTKGHDQAGKKCLSVAAIHLR